MKSLLPLSLVVLLSACNGSDVIIISPPVNEPDAPTEMTVNTDFNQGENGWAAGFSDYPVDNADIFDLTAEIAPLPTDASAQGFLLSGHNRSDDLFMFLKHKVTGLEANTRYSMTGEITFLSNAGVGCVGIGGAPGESVYVKTGATELEPAQAEYYMNIDIGDQSNPGNDSVVLGDVAVEAANCGGDVFAEKTLALAADSAFDIITSPEGEAWVFVGTDSGFEGRTDIYYRTINLTFTP